MQLTHALTGRGLLRLSPYVAGILAVLSLQNCGGGEDLCTGPFCITPPGRQDATRLKAVSGGGQVGAPGRELAQPLEVVVTNDNDRPIPDFEVSFTVVGPGDGAISQPATSSDRQGRVRVRWTLGAAPGVQTVQAVATDSSGNPLDGSPQTFTAQALSPRPASILLLQPPSTLAQSGLPFSGQPVVGVFDADNQPVALVNVTASLASGDGTLEGITTVSTDAEGHASYSNLAIRGAAGARTLRFGVSDPALEVVSAAVQVEAGAAATLVGNEPLTYTGTVHSPVTPAPSVMVRDADGNPVAGVAVIFAADRDGLVSPITKVTNAQGVAQVTSWTLGRSAGVRYGLTARMESGGSNQIAFSALAQAGRAGQLEIQVQPPATAQSGVPFSRQPIIQVTDALGNPASQAGLVITATLSTGPGGTLEHASATTDGSGRATFDNLAITGLAGDHSLSFSSPDLTGAASEPISLAAGAPSRLVLAESPPAEARSRAPFATQPSIQLEDASGNPVPQAGIEVSASLASGEGTLGGQMTALTNGEGRADFTDLAIIGPPGAHSLRFASSSPASEVLSSTITLPNVVAISLGAAPTSPVVVATTLTAPVSWTLTDAAGQPVADAPAAVVVSAGGSVGPVSASDPSGVVQLPSWTISQTAGAQYVELQVSGQVSRVTVVAVAGAAFSLGYTSGDAQSAPVNSELPLPMVVRVVDQYGNGVSGVMIQWRTCEGEGAYDAPTDPDGYGSAFQTTGDVPGPYCAMASAPGLAGSPVQFSYTVTAAPSEATAPSSDPRRARPPGPRLEGR